jgi:uncharacterized membrane protein
MNVPAMPSCPTLRVQVLLSLVLASSCVLFAAPAQADFRLCNNTASRVGIAVGYRDKEGWLTEGWWNVSPKSCEVVLRGPLAARYYYVYAIDYDQGGEWSGKSFMCTRGKEFTIRGFENCLARGYDRTGFFEIDSGEQKSWTVQLSEQAQPGAKPKSSAPEDVTPSPPGTPGAQPPAAPPGLPPTTPPLLAPPGVSGDPVPSPAPAAAQPGTPADTTPTSPGSPTTPQDPQPSSQTVPN